MGLTSPCLILQWKELKKLVRSEVGIHGSNRYLALFFINVFIAIAAPEGEQLKGLGFSTLFFVGVIGADTGQVIMTF